MDLGARRSATLYSFAFIFLVGCAIKSVPTKMGDPEWGVEVISHGHSCFSLSDDTGRTIVIDPYDETVGYGRLKLYGHALFITHDHFDHDYRKAVLPLGGALDVVETSGTYSVAGGMSVTAIPSFHDDEQGEIYGPNLIFTFMMAGLRIVHLGDLGQTELDNRTLATIGEPDILFIPVGGFVTLNAVQAKKIVEQLKPKVVVPMHYGNARFYKLDSEKNFIELFAKDNVELIAKAEIRFRQSDLTKNPTVVVFGKNAPGK